MWEDWKGRLVGVETDRRGRGPSGSIRGERERLTSASYRVPEVGTFAQHLLRARGGTWRGTARQTVGWGPIARGFGRKDN